MLTVVSLNYRIRVGFCYTFAYLHFLYQTCLSFVTRGREKFTQRETLKYMEKSKRVVLRNCQLPNTPHGRAGRGCSIPQMPRRPQITCVPLECTGGIVGLPGFLGAHIQQNSDASLWRTFWSLSCFEFCQGLEKQESSIPSYLCEPLPPEPTLQ